MMASAGADRHHQDEHIAMNLRRDSPLMACFQGDKDAHPLVQAIMSCLPSSSPATVSGRQAMCAASSNRRHPAGPA